MAPKKLGAPPPQTVFRTIIPNSILLPHYKKQKNKLTKKYKSPPNTDPHLYNITTKTLGDKNFCQILRKKPLKRT